MSGVCTSLVLILIVVIVGLIVKYYQKVNIGCDCRNLNENIWVELFNVQNLLQ